MQNIKDIRSFLGLCSYYRRFVKDFAKLAKTLTHLTKNNVPFIWNDEQEDAFRRLKRALTSPPVLAHYSETAPTALHTDASSYGLEAVLVQEQDGKERVIAHASRSLSKAESNYSTTERECLAAVWAITKFHP